jgi:hypothetical protein
MITSKWVVVLQTTKQQQVFMFSEEARWMRRSTMDPKEVMYELLLRGVGACLSQTLSC